MIADRIGRFVLEYDLSRLDSLDAAAALERMLTVFGTLTLEPRTIALTRLVLGECCAFPEVGADVLRKRHRCARARRWRTGSAVSAPAA